MVRRYNKIIFFFLIFFIPFAPVRKAFPSEKNIGVIFTGDIPYYKEVHKSFVETLSSHGYGPEKINIVLQTPAPGIVSWRNAAKKLVAYEMSIIVAFGTPATRAVLSETSTIPVVFAGVYDPEILGKKGKNVTGITSFVPVVTAIKFLRLITPFKRLGIVYNDSEIDTVRQAEEVKALEAQFGFQSVRFNIKKPDDSFRISGVDALFLTTSCVARQCLYNVTQVVHRERLPAVSIIGLGEESGAVLVFSPDPAEQGRVAAEMVVRILRGESPANIPVERPRKVEMVVNLKEASIIGIKVPLDVLSSATKVIK